MARNTDNVPKPLKGIRNQDLYGQKQWLTDTETANQIASDYNRAKYLNYKASQGSSGWNVDIHGPEPATGGLQNYGESKYDTTSIFQATEQDINDTRYQNQPWWDVVANDVIKTGVLAGTTYLQGTAGLLFGAGNVLYEGLQKLITGKSEHNTIGAAFWDNPLNRALNQGNDVMEDLFKVYRSTKMQEAPWYSTDKWANFRWLADDLIKNVGFTIGAIASGNSLSAAANLVSRGGLAAADAALSSFLSGVSTKSDFINKIAQTLSKAPGIVSGVTGGLFSAINEGSTEAIQNSQQFGDYQRAKERDEYIYKLNQAKQLYGNTEFGNQLIREINHEHRERIQQIQNAQENMGNYDLLFNLPVLLASNVVQFGRLYSKGFDSTRRVLLKETEKGLEAVKNTSAKGILRTAGKIIKNPVSEGMEEVNQQAASDIAGRYEEANLKNFYARQSDPDAKIQANSWFDAVTEGLAQTYMSDDTWSQFLVGAVTGALGLPGGHRDANGKFKLDWYGGVQEVLRHQGIDTAEAQRVADYINQRRSSPEFQNYYRGFVRHQAYENDIQAAAEKGDKFEFHNAKDAQLISDIVMFDRAGKLEEYKQMVKDAFKGGPQEAQAVLDNIDNSINKDNNGNTSNSTEETERSVSEAQNDVLNAIDEYTKIKQRMESEVGNSITDDMLQERVYMQMQIQQWNKRADSMIKGVKPLLQRIQNILGNFRGDISQNPDEVEKAQKAYDIVEKAMQANDLSSLGQVLAGEKGEGIDALNDAINILNKYDAIGQNTTSELVNAINDINKMYQEAGNLKKQLDTYIAHPEKQAQDQQDAEKDNDESFDEKTNPVEDQGTPDLQTQLQEKASNIIEGNDNVDNPNKVNKFVNSLISQIANKEAIEVTYPKGSTDNDKAIMKDIYNSFMSFLKTQSAAKKPTGKKKKKSSFSLSKLSSTPERDRDEEEDGVVGGSGTTNTGGTNDNDTDNGGTDADTDNGDTEPQKNEPPRQSTGAKKISKKEKKPKTTKPTKSTKPKEELDFEQASKEQSAAKTLNEQQSYNLTSSGNPEYNTSELKAPGFRIERYDSEAVQYLRNLGAYSFVNSGKLAILLKKHPKLQVRFIVDNTVQDSQGNPVILLAVSADNRDVNYDHIYQAEDGNSYQIIGFLGFHGNNKYSVQAYNMLKKDILAEWEQNSGNTGYIYPGYTEIAHIFSGRSIIKAFGDNAPEQRSVQEVLTSDGLTSSDIGFVIYYDNANSTSMEEMLQNDEVQIQPLNTNNSSSRKGTVWIYTKGADGVYYPKAVEVLRTNEGPLNPDNDTPIKRKVMELLRIIADDSKSLDDRLSAKGKLFGVRDSNGNWSSTGIIYLGKDSPYNILISNDGKHITFQGPEENSQANIESAVDGNTKKEILDNIVKNLLSHIINTHARFSVRINNEGVLVNKKELINSGVFTTDLITFKPLNASFNIYPVNIKTGKPRIYKGAKYGHTGFTGRQNKPDNVILDSKRYQVDGTVVTTEDGSPVSDETASVVKLLRDITRGSAEDKKIPGTFTYVGHYTDGTMFGLRKSGKVLDADEVQELIDKQEKKQSKSNGKSLASLFLKQTKESKGKKPSLKLSGKKTLDNGEFATDSNGSINLEGEALGNDDPLNSLFDEVDNTDTDTKALEAAQAKIDKDNGKRTRKTKSSSRSKSAGTKKSTTKSSKSSQKSSGGASSFEDFLGGGFATADNSMFAGVDDEDNDNGNEGNSGSKKPAIGRKKPTGGGFSLLKSVAELKSSTDNKISIDADIEKGLKSASVRSLLNKEETKKALGNRQIRNVSQLYQFLQEKGIDDSMLKAQTDNDQLATLIQNAIFCK